MHSKLTCGLEVVGDAVCKAQQLHLRDGEVEQLAGVEVAVAEVGAVGQRRLWSPAVRQRLHQQRRVQVGT